MTNPTIKRHWTTEHYPDAVPIDLWELIRALTAQYNKNMALLRYGGDPDFLVTQESFLERVNHYTQGGTKLDAYRLYPGDDPLEPTVGIRYGDEGSEYISPHLTREIADQFDLDPLNKESV